MKKREEKEIVGVPKYVFSQDQLKTLERELRRHGGDPEKLLIYHKAINVVDHRWYIRRLEGLSLEGLEILPGLGIQYTTEYPYDFWNEALEAVASKQNKRAYAKKMEELEREKLAESMSVKDEELSTEE